MTAATTTVDALTEARIATADAARAMLAWAREAPPDEAEQRLELFALSYNAVIALYDPQLVSQARARVVAAQAAAGRLEWTTENTVAVMAGIVATLASGRAGC